MSDFARVERSGIRPFARIMVGDNKICHGQDLEIIKGCNILNAAHAESVKPLVQSLESLKEYAHHKTGCDAEGAQECDCGLSDLLKELEAYR